MIKMFAAMQEVPVPVADASVSLWVWVVLGLAVLMGLVVWLSARSAAHRRERRIAQTQAAERHTRARIIVWEGVGGFPPHSFPQRRVGIYLPEISAVIVRSHGVLNVIGVGEGTALYDYKDLGEITIPLELFEAAKSLLGSKEHLDEHTTLVDELLTPYDRPPRADWRATLVVVSKPD